MCTYIPMYTFVLWFHTMYLHVFIYYLLALYRPYLILLLYVLHISLVFFLYLVSTYFKCIYIYIYTYVCIFTYSVCFYILHRLAYILLDLQSNTISIQHVLFKFKHIYIYYLVIYTYIYICCLHVLFLWVFWFWPDALCFQGGAPTSLDHKALAALCAKLELEEPRAVAQLGWLELGNQTCLAWETAMVRRMCKLM